MCVKVDRQTNKQTQRETHKMIQRETERESICSLHTMFWTACSCKNSIEVFVYFAAVQTKCVLLRIVLGVSFRIF